MTLALRLPHPRRTLLDAGWEMAPAGSTAWQAIGPPQPVAAALALAGTWSLDDPPRRFDAEAWEFRLRFDAPVGWSDDPLRLGLDGIATVAATWLNGEPLFTSRSMFRAHAVDLPAPCWRAQGNELRIQVDALDAQLAPRRARPRWRAPMVEHQQLRWWRTTLLGRTPGWSPAAALVGPWRPVWVEPDDGEAITVLAREARLVRAADGTLRGELDLALRWPAATARGHALVASLAHGAQRVDLRLTADDDGLLRGTLVVDAVAPWWPHTHGEPALYRLVVHEQGATALPRALGQVGFRRIEIDTGPDGDGFGLRVNGVPVFCRGACWVPQDTLRLHAPAAHHAALLARLAAAGLNMLRVGGTGAYEDAGFFEACDAAGVLVWQEFMCANMDYPADDPAFADDFAAEVDAQLALWRNHACVAVVCGNSEVAQQAAMWGADRADWAPPLFHVQLAARVAATLPGTPWWPSSAWGGAFPFQPAQGTCSYYGVGAYLRPLADARSSGLRFATEALAFAQVPDEAAMTRLAARQGGLPLRSHQPLWKERVPRDLGAGWDFDDVRDHYLGLLVGTPATELRRVDPAAYWTLSRAACAETVAAAFQQWRDPASACRGALVWFLRDLRAGAGWGVLDEQGHAKPAFHALARSWQPQHLGLTDEGQNGVFVQVVNDRPAPLAATLSLSFHQGGAAAVGQVRRAVSLPAHGAWRDAVLAEADGFLDLNGSYRFGPAAAEVVVARLLDDAGTAWRECVLFLGERLVVRPLQAVGLAAHGERVNGPEGQLRAIQVTVSTQAAARAVHFESPDWRPDDEYFHLGPGSRRVVNFHPVDPAAPRPWHAQVAAINAEGWALVETPA